MKSPYYVVELDDATGTYVYVRTETHVRHTHTGCTSLYMLHICMFIHVYIYVHKYICIYIYIYIYEYIYICIYLYV